MDYYKAKKKNKGREKTIKGIKREKTKERKRVSALIWKRRSFCVYCKQEANQKQFPTCPQKEKKKTILFIETKKMEKRKELEVYLFSCCCNSNKKDWDLTIKEKMVRKQNM